MEAYITFNDFMKRKVQNSSNTVINPTVEDIYQCGPYWFGCVDSIGTLTAYFNTRLDQMQVPQDTKVILRGFGVTGTKIQIVGDPSYGQYIRACQLKNPWFRFVENDANLSGGTPENE
jgi:hypothetical protein